MTPDVEVYRDGFVHVRAEQCDHCLFSASRLVSGARARELVDQTRATVGSSFVCHRSHVSDEHDAVCKAWYDAFAADDPIFRFAQHCEVVVFDTPT